MNVSTRAEAMAPATAQIVPKKLAHFVIRTNKFAKMLEWYRTVFHAKTSFENPVIAFLTYDDEHHRFAFLNSSQMPSPDKTYTGFDHVAFTYASIFDLLNHYDRLKGLGIKPFWCLNHGPTTSMYYYDPDGNELEFQVDNYATIEEATAYFFSKDFEANPIGIDFDPDALLAKMRGGATEGDLLKLGAAPVKPGTEFKFIKVPPPPG
jgi:catechol 2,3-dioxygenase-like lactoylglutathione lyase family enzyme